MDARLVGLLEDFSWKIRAYREFELCIKTGLGSSDFSMPSIEVPVNEDDKLVLRRGYLLRDGPEPMHMEVVQIFELIESGAWREDIVRRMMDDITTFFKRIAQVAPDLAKQHDVFVACSDPLLSPDAGH